MPKSTHDPERLRSAIVALEGHLEPISREALPISDYRARLAALDRVAAAMVMDHAATLAVADKRHRLILAGVEAESGFGLRATFEAWLTRARDTLHGRAAA